MSLLNAWITPAEAIVAVDTDGVQRDGTVRPMAKLYPIPHLQAVLAFRGQGAFALEVVHACLARAFRTFDDLLAALPLLASRIDVNLPEDLRVPGFGIRNEFLAVGWSHSRAQIFGQTLKYSAEHGQYLARDSNGCIAPYDAATMAQIPQTPDQLEELARAQVRYLQAHSGLGGGELVLCSLTRESLILNHVLTFEREAEACRH